MSETAARPVRIAVVGHTNTGKTSLLRTLTRDTGFGEVSSRPSTTRHVEGARLIAAGEVLVELYDTPGLEDPIALLETVEALTAPDGGRLDAPARIARFLETPAATARFEQEAKVLRQLLASDAGLYVIDARDPLLAKHRDELSLLGGCAVPLLPVLNFVREPGADERGWREALARLGLHAVVRFDTVAPERDGESRLYTALATLLDAHRPTLERLIASREREAAARRAAALRLIAELLIDVAACRRAVPAGSADGLTAAVSDLNARVRAREQACVEALLVLYRFSPDAVDADRLPLMDGRWEDDLFHPETLRRLGVKVGGGAAAGAAAGVGIDLMVGGITLGAAAVLGALLGGGWQALRQLRSRLLGKLTGQVELSVNDAILRLLALRQLHLLQALESRGHAALVPIRQLAADADALRNAALPEALRRSRAHPDWSGLYGGVPASGAREAAIEALAAGL
ncbi:MAG: DUF3482 domain-containing protein [Gammaproteobacteria bacterium]